MTVSSLINRYFSGSSSPDQMSAATIAEFQKEALQEVITQAYEKSPFYQGKMTEVGVKPQDIKNLGDLAKMPFTLKEELRQNPWALLACDKKEINLIHVSTGTTGGKEIYTLHTWKDYHLNHTLIYPKLIPIEPEDLCFVALPYEMSSVGFSKQTDFIAGYQAAVVPVGKGGAYSTPEKTIRVMRDLNPTIVVTTPSYAMTLAEAAAEASFDLTSLRLKKMWVGGEGCSPTFRERVEKIWGTPVNFSYGITECGSFGYECDTHHGYHLCQGHVLVEIVDPETGKVLEPGQIGELVITSLLRFDTPLIRYRTQDLGYLDPKPCSCGVGLPKLYLKGRAVDQIVLNGKPYSPIDLEEFLMGLPEVGNWYQFIVKANNNEQLKIRTELASEIEPSPELAKQLASQLETAIGVPCKFEFVTHFPRPQGKAVRVVRA